MVNNEDTGQVVKNDKNLPDFTQVQNQGLETDAPKPVEEDISVNNKDLPEELKLKDESNIEEPLAASGEVNETKVATEPVLPTATDLPEQSPAPQTVAAAPASSEVPGLATTPTSTDLPVPPTQSANIPTGVPLPISNTVAVGANGPMPVEMQHWSWGAFSLTWIWALANKTYIGLLALLGPLALPMAIVLGIKGNEWAWNNRKWASVEEFKKTQGAWAKWGLILLVFSLALNLIVLIYLISLLTPATTTTPTITNSNIYFGY